MELDTWCAGVVEGVEVEGGEEGSDSCHEYGRCLAEREKLGLFLMPCEEEGGGREGGGEGGGKGE